MRAVGRRLPSMTCLIEAMALQDLLARRGWSAQLRIGVRNHGESLEAHAWLESGGRVLIGDMPDLGSYQTLAAPVSSVRTWA